MPHDLIRKKIYNLHKIRNAIKHAFQENGMVNCEEFSKFCALFEIEATTPFSVAVERIIIYCDKNNKYEQLLSELRSHPGKRYIVKFSFFNHLLKYLSFSKKQSKCRITVNDPNLSLDDCEILLCALGSDFDICREEIEVERMKEGSIILDIKIPSDSLDKLIELYEANDPVIKNLGIEYVMELLVSRYNIKNIKKLLSKAMYDDEVIVYFYNNFNSAFFSLPYAYKRQDVIDALFEYAYQQDRLQEVLGFIRYKKPKLYDKYGSYYAVPRRPFENKAKKSNIGTKLKESAFILGKGVGVSVIGILILFFANYFISKLFGGQAASVVWLALAPLGSFVGRIISDATKRNREKRVAFLAVMCYVIGCHLGYATAYFILSYFLFGVFLFKKFLIILFAIYIFSIFNIISSDPIGFMFSLIGWFLGCYNAYKRVREG